MSILRIESSANTQGSVTRKLTDDVIGRLGNAPVTTRDLAKTPLPAVTQDWITARLVPEGERTAADRETMALSDALVSELRAADTLVIGVPIYNFSVPASLKAWIDLIAIPGVTFRYSDTGPIGLMTGKRAIIAVASGGVPVGSEVDFATGYLRHVLGFVGITDVHLVSADALAKDPDGTMQRAQEQIQEITRDAA